MKRKTIGICVCTLLIATTFACLAPAASAADPDLRVSDLYRGYIGTPRYWQVCYILYNAGSEDIENASFTDAAWYYWGVWYKIATSEIRHTNFYLEAHSYSNAFCWNWYAPPGWHWISQWTDIYEEIPDQNYDNNYKAKYWNWNDL